MAKSNTLEKTLDHFFLSQKTWEVVDYSQKIHSSYSARTFWYKF